MARGWESKVVEEQVNDRDAANREADLDSARLTNADRERERKLGSLRLSRVRIVDQLKTATNPAYRHTLERALQSLDSQIAEISDVSTD